MARFAVGIVQYAYSACFEDFGHAFADALRALGHEVVSPMDPQPGRFLMLGAGNMVDTAGKMPADAICYNAEQVAAVGDKAGMYLNVEQYARRIIWDYSRANIIKLQELGCQRVVHCPIGYMPGMTNSIASGAFEGGGTQVKDITSTTAFGGGSLVKDIDVLFYGSECERRTQVLAALSKAGLKVVRLFNVYGAERDKHIARAKVVLNMHYYEGGVFEIFRVSHLLANKACVVSEAGGVDEELEQQASGMTCHVPYDQIVETCVDLVAYKSEREHAAEWGHAAFKRTSMVDNVRRALEASDV
jgi:hypothetical protein